MDITTVVKNLKENDLRNKVVKPTLLAIGIYKVEDWHGNNEDGKDLYFSYKDPFGDYKHCCCFIKSGNITKSGKTDIRKMEGQLKEAMITKFVSPIDNKNEVKAEEIYILCSGQVNKEAKEYIHQMVYAHAIPNINIIDGDKLVRIILGQVINPFNKKNKKNYNFILESYSDVCAQMREQINYNNG